MALHHPVVSGTQASAPACTAQVSGAGQARLHVLPPLHEVSLSRLVAMREEELG